MNVRWPRILIYSLGGFRCGLLLLTWNQRDIQRFHLDIMSNDLRHQARLMEPLFHFSGATTDSQLDALRDQTPYPTTIINGEGRLVADSLFSGEDLKKMENQLNQEEIVEAGQNGTGFDLRYHETTGGWVLFAAAQSSGGGFIRLAQPVSGPNPTEDPL